MAQGCHLIFTEEDRVHFDFHDRPVRLDEEARQSVLEGMGIPLDRFQRNIVSGGEKGTTAINRSEAIHHGVEEGQFEIFETRWSESSQKDRNTLGRILLEKADKQAAFIQGLGNAYLQDKMALAVPEALERIYQQDSKAIGLFEQARSYATAWVDNLKVQGKGKADGIAYEVLATASLIDREAKSRNGQSLEVFSTDRLAFGVKQQASYGPQGPMVVTDRQTRDIFHQPHRSTVEADLLITRPVGLFGDFKQIGVDFKHTSVGSTCRIDQEQLEGVFTALRTGEVDEFHFVSNRAFDEETAKSVAQLNQQIEEYNQGPNNWEIPEIELFENYQWTRDDLL